MQQTLEVAFKWMLIPSHKKALSLKTDCFECVVPAMPITDVCKKPALVNATLTLTLNPFQQEAKAVQRTHVAGIISSSVPDKLLLRI